MKTWDKIIGRISESLLSPKMDDDNEMDDYDGYYEDEIDDYDDPFYDSSRRSRRYQRADISNCIRCLRKGKTRDYNNPNDLTLCGITIRHPDTIKDAIPIARLLREGKTIVFSVTNIHPLAARRIVDYLCGFVLGSGAKIKKISDKQIYVLIPAGIDIKELEKEAD